MEDLKNDVVSVGESLAPDADWMPCLFLRSPDAIIPLLVDPTGDIGGQIALGIKHVLASFTDAKGNRAVAAALVNTAWMVAKNQGVEPSVRSLEDHPRRVEVLTVVGVDRDGNAQQLMAQIKRSSSHPTLEAWMATDYTHLEGRLVDALREGIGS